MSHRIRHARRVAAVMVVLAVVGGATAPVAHAAPKTTTDSGKKWK